MTKKSWVQDPETGKLVPKEEWRGPRSEAPAIHGDIEGFVSPVDGSHITSRSALRAHNHRHGVTDCRDYSPGYLLERSQRRISEMTGQTPAAKRERTELIRRTIANHERNRS